MKTIENQIEEFNDTFNKADEFLVTKILPQSVTVNSVHQVKEWLAEALEERDRLAREDESAKHAGKVNGTPCFEWMHSWLLAYEKQNEGNEGLADLLIDWIKDQPMSSS
jgi:hypothetical protein